MTVEELRENLSGEGGCTIFGGETEEQIKEVAEALSAAFGVSIGHYLEESYDTFPYLFLDRHSNGTITVEGYFSKQGETIFRDEALAILYGMSDTSINVMDVL